jgi:hypothetical protein
VPAAAPDWMPPLPFPLAMVDFCVCICCVWTLNLLLMMLVWRILRLIELGQPFTGRHIIFQIPQFWSISKLCHWKKKKI